MGNSRFSRDDLVNPPEKVRLMFQAVNELLTEKADISTMKVQDITARAGIGKGTAYEYFTTKEELITMALLYDHSQKIAELKSLLEKQSHFQDMMYCLLDWLQDNSSYHMTFMRMIQINAGGPDLFRNLQRQIPEDVLNGMFDFVLENIDMAMEAGYQEGEFTETDVMKRRLAFATMIFQVVTAQGEPSQRKLFDIRYEELRQYAYKSMLKILR